jgi:hypothetical protein
MVQAYRRRIQGAIISFRKVIGSGDSPGLQSRFADRAPECTKLQDIETQGRLTRESLHAEAAGSTELQNELTPELTPVLEPVSKMPKRGKLRNQPLP